MRLLTPLLLILAGAATAAGCAPTARSTSAALVPPPQVVIVDLRAQESSRGHKLFLRVFDLLLDEATESSVVLSTDSLAVSRTPDDRPLNLSIDGLSFEIATGQDRLALGSVVEGRQFLIARAMYTLVGGSEAARSGQAIGRASLTGTGLRLESYSQALTSLAQAIARDAAVP